MGTENDHREEEINTSPLEADGDLEVFDFTPTPFTVKTKPNLNSDSGKMVLWGMSPLSCCLTDFPKEVIIPCPNYLLLDYWPFVQQAV